MFYCATHDIHFATAETFGRHLVNIDAKPERPEHRMCRERADDEVVPTKVTYREGDSKVTAYVPPF